MLDHLTAGAAIKVRFVHKTFDYPPIPADVGAQLAQTCARAWFPPGFVKGY